MPCVCHTRMIDKQLFDIPKQTLMKKQNLGRCTTGRETWTVLEMFFYRHNRITNQCPEIYERFSPNLHKKIKKNGQTFFSYLLICLNNILFKYLHVMPLIYLLFCEKWYIYYLRKNMEKERLRNWEWKISEPKVNILAFHITFLPNYGHAASVNEAKLSIHVGN